MSSHKHFNCDVTKLIDLSKNDSSLITIEATVITGFENMAMDECQEKCKPFNICRAKGRIYFNIPLDRFSNVLNLRAVDNVFLVNDALGEIALQDDKEKDLELVRSLVDRINWKGTLTTWAKLTEFEGILFPHFKNIVEKHAEDLTKIVLDGKNDNLSDKIVNNTKIINIKASTDSDMNDVLDKQIELGSDENLSSFSEPKNESQECRTNPKIEVNVVLNKKDIIEPLGQRERSPKHRDSSSSDESYYSVEETEFDCGNPVKNLPCDKTLLNQTSVDTKQAFDNSENGNKIKKSIDTKNIDPNILKFRATCNRTGNHSFSSMEAAAVFGGSLQDKFNWTVNLSNYNLNVILNINSDKCYICSAITPKSLHRRNITHFGYTTLRSTMCYNMLRIAEPTKGEIIIDPLCGGGSIPIEGALSFHNTFYICGDNNDKAINRTAANIDHITKTQPLLVDPLMWSAKRLPLRDQCVDVFVTDLPFGKRSGKKSDNLNLYKNVLTEMARVIRCGTGRAVLLTNDKSSLTRAMGGNNGIYWRQINSFGVNQGGLFSTVFLLLRTSKPYLL